MFAAIERLVAVQDIGGLTKRETEVGPVERDVPETHHGASRGLLRRHPVRVRLDPRQWDPPLHASLHFDELELHVNGRCELRLRRAKLLQLADFARLCARRSRGSFWRGHGRIVQSRIGNQELWLRGALARC